MIINRNLSNYYSQKLYSTGDDYLDDLLERAFCEGYEYAQKEFGNKENKAAKRAYEMGLGHKNIYTLMDAANEFVDKQDKFKTMDNALVHTGRELRKRENKTPLPWEGSKFKNISQKINFRGRMNTDKNTGRSRTDNQWKYTHEDIQYANKKNNILKNK